jgi:exosortase A-associated hydrolase 1
MGAIMRGLIAFPCAGETLVGTLDEAPGKTGLLVVSGGNEIRSGAHRGMALLGQRLATAGYPVFRYDRRGIGDSTGENRGFESSAEDIAAAAATFRERAGFERVIGFGNCDAATALALFHRVAGIDGLILANPWVIEQADDLPPPAAIRAYYAARLRDPMQWLRLLRGKVNVAKLGEGLAKASQTPAPSGLAERLATALAQAPTTILLARRDNTAIAFADAWKHPAFEAARRDIKLVERDSASHSFASQADKDWLFEQILRSLSEAP